MGGDEYDLASLGKWTRVDWHKNPARIHVFISKIPLKDLAQSKDNKIIEVYGEKPHVVCVYGNHFDGNPIMPYETEKIAVLDDITRLEIENRVKLVIPSYLDNDAVNKYVKELEKPETIVSKGSVHIAVRTMLMSVYFRSNGKFANIPDEERFQRVVDWDKQKAIQAGRPAYIDANPKKLEDLWEGIRKKYQDQRQKEREEGRKERANGNGNGTTPPEESSIRGICSIVASFEEDLLYKMFEFFHKHDISLASCISIIQILTNDDEERRYKINLLEQVYKDSKDVTSKHLLDALAKKFGYDDAKKILE
ncbi:MAG: hypothetical protein WBZ36_26455 [Candidatus Nitrosopolaris sp.]